MITSVTRELIRLAHRDFGLVMLLGHQWHNDSKGS